MDRLKKEGRQVLQLSISTRSDRELIEEYLSEGVSVKIQVGPVGARPFDLCLLDEASFTKHKKKLQQLKKQAAPVFLPILLLSKSQRKARGDSAVIEFVDDVVYLPVSETVLQSRVQMLLRQREYSLQLEEKNRLLAREKERYRLITENATDMVVISDLEGTFSYVSPSAEKVVGYKPDELLGRSMYEFFHPDDEVALSKAKEALLGNSSGDYKVSFRFKTKEQGYKWMESNVRSIAQTNNGKVTEVQSAVRDISHRKAYEQKLEEEKAFIDSAVESLPGIFFMLDETLRFVRWNNNFNDLLGYNDPDIREMEPSDLVEARYSAAMQAKIKETWQRGAAEFELPLVTKAGKSVSYYLQTKTIRREGESFMMGTGIDISERVAVENKLRESEQRWEKLVKKNPSMVQLTNRAGVILFANPACAEFYGVADTGKLEGQNFEDFISFEEAKTLRRQMVQALQGQTTSPNTYKVRFGDARDGVILLQAVRVKHENEQVLLTVAKDITERYKYESKLKESLSEKKTLLQEIHHRVKNNLAVVSGMLQLQAFKTEDKALKRHLSTSEKRIKTMGLIHETLYQSESLSQINFGSYTCNLIDYIQQVPADTEDVELELEYDYFELNINQAVPSALILNELVSNAYEHAFADQQGGKIVVELREQDDLISIKVADNGGGFPEDFDARKEQSMGFTIIETLVKQLQAELTICTEQGVAISFSFRRQHQIKGSASSLV